MISTDTMAEEHAQAQDIVLALAASPGFAHDGICFAARASGLYRSEDGGRNWHFAYERLDLGASLATTAVAISPDFETDHSVFAGVHGVFCAQLMMVTAGIVLDYPRHRRLSRH